MKYYHIRVPENKAYFIAELMSYMPADVKEVVDVAEIAALDHEFEQVRSRRGRKPKMVDPAYTSEKLRSIMQSIDDMRSDLKQ